MHTDPAFADECRQRVVVPRREQGRTVFHRAVDRGEIPADTNIEVALDLLYGPLYHRLLHGHAPLGDRFVNDVVDTALHGIQRPADPSPGPTDDPGEGDHDEPPRSSPSPSPARPSESLNG